MRNMIMLMLLLFIITACNKNEKQNEKISDTSPKEQVEQTIDNVTDNVTDNGVDNTAVTGSWVGVGDAASYGFSIKNGLLFFMSFGQSMTVIPGFFSITLIGNTGAAFSILSSNTLLLIVISIIVLNVIYSPW